MMRRSVVRRALVQLREAAASLGGPEVRYANYRAALAGCSIDELEHLLAVFAEGTVHGAQSARELADV